MKNETAINLLLKKLWSEFGLAFSNNITNEFKEIEKNQIVNAHFEGWSDAYDYLDNDKSTARQAPDYYEETYNENKL